MLNHSLHFFVLTSKNLHKKKQCNCECFNFLILYDIDKVLKITSEFVFAYTVYVFNVFENLNTGANLLERDNTIIVTM